jgi:hypothetical protein
LLASCGTINQGPVPATVRPGASVDHVATLMIGDYSSAAQASKDPAHFKSVALHMVPIWIDRTDGRWLYVEQAMTDTPDKPYRQRVYCVLDRGDGVESRVFELPGNPLALAGAWKQPERLNALTPALLVPREGCSVRLRPQPDGSWKGGTDGQGCESTRQGASYATSEVTLTGGRIETWDRGFDAAGKQVWGSTEGPYIFLKEATK